MTVYFLSFMNGLYKEEEIPYFCHFTQPMSHFIVHQNLLCCWLKMQIPEP